ncbi:hypothetical protein [Sphingomonas sp.]|uniref:hypothetical protein n=1 Tax=Sphingomonas sp. TaxID=28214 RepID=UPI002DD695F2|nr:hypothetical protein [Sphingomonas sp.]
MQAYWSGAAACAAVAVAGMIADRRRVRRDDPDRVGVVNWTTVQLAAMFGAVLLGALAVTAR